MIGVIIITFLLNTDATREQAIKEWEKLEKLNVPKNYKPWKKYKNKQIN